MNSKIAIERVKQLLQKQDVLTYADFTNWDFEDAFNKAQNDWFRRQKHGVNLLKEQDEETTMKVDDLQHLLTSKKLYTNNTKLYADTGKIPEDYRYYNKLSIYASKSSCQNTLIPSKFVENANTDEFLADWNFSPSFDFEQCFHVMLGNKFRIFHGGDFTVDKAEIFYYRHPRPISCTLSNMEQEWELKEDVAELIIDEAARNMAGSIEHVSAAQLAEKRLQEDT